MDYHPHSRLSKMGLPKTVGNHSGFTLIEILISLLLVSILLTTLFAAFRGLLHQTQPLTQQTEMTKMAAAALKRFGTDLSQVVVSLPPAYRKPEFNSDPDPYRIVGKSDTSFGKSVSQLQFASLGHVPTINGRQSGVARIVYYISETQSDEKVLRRSDHLFPYDEFEPQFTDPVLCRQVEEFAVYFTTADGGEIETWNSDAESVAFATPQAIRIVLTLKDSQKEWQFESRHQLPTLRKALKL